MQYSFQTVSGFVDQALSETLGSSTSLITTLNDTSLIRQVDRIVRKFLDAARKAPNEQWSWMEDKQEEFETYNATALSAIALDGASTFAVDSVTGFPTSGRVWIDTDDNATDFVDYSSIATLTLTVDTSGEAITIDHASGDHVELLYAVPSDLRKVIDPIYVGGIEYFESRAGIRPVGRQYRIVDNYIMFPQDIGTNDAVLRYERGSAALATGDDQVDRAKETLVPVDFERYVIEMLIAYIQTKRRKRQAALDALIQAQVELDNALETDINQSANYIY